MRQGQQNRRGRGRGRKPQNPLSRNLESNGPDVKIRGTASHIAEKYTALARDAQVAGDSVAGESYLQHAEHYNRIIMANQAQQQATLAAQGDGMNGSGRDRQNTSAEGDGRAQPEAAPAVAATDNSASDKPASDNSASDKSASDKSATDAVAETAADPKITGEKTTGSSETPSGGASSKEAGNDEGLARMMARSTTSSGNGADKEKRTKAAKAPKAAEKESGADDAGSDDAGADDMPDEAVT
jgi:hypothetical protein